MAVAPDEFADWLSPILVKELRQGMRTRVFVGSFILLQIAMVFLSLFGLSAAAQGKSTEDFSTTFWVMVGVPLLVIMPGSGLGAVANERKGNTLELVFLSRLTARRILLGKWIALLLQSVLLVSAIIPYAVLRYFLGGVNVTQELEILAVLFYVSALFSGVAVGISPLPSAATRSIFGVALFFGLYAVSAFLIMRVASSFGVSGPMPFSGLSRYSGAGFVALAVAVAFAVLYLFWEYGSGLIAPPVENHSTPLRLLALGSLGVGALSAFLAPGYRFATLPPALLLGLLICVGLLCEKTKLIPALYRPFVRRGWWARCTGWLLYPGWPSGVLFTIVFFLLALASSLRLLPGKAEHLNADDLRRVYLGALSALGVLLLPMALVRTLYPRVPRAFLAFFLVQIIFLALFAAGAVVHAFSPALNPTHLFRLFPAYALVTLDEPREATAWEQFGGAAIVTVASILVLLWQMRRPWLEIRAAERQAA